MTYKLLMAGCFGSVFLFCTACRHDQRSTIEVIKYDPELTRTIQAHFDSTKKIIHPHQAWYSTEQYYRRPAEEDWIVKDSFEHVVAVIRMRSGHNYFSAEYYSNGQLKGKYSDDKDGFADGPVTYFYEDGRISLTGTYRHSVNVGTWRTYGKDGKLKKVTYFSDNGEFERVEAVGK